MLVVLKKRVWQVVLLWAMALGVCYANSQADEYYKLAKSYHDSKDYGKSVFYWKKLIEMGDAKGYNGMGYMYDYGHGVVKDDAKAIQYYQKAADMGYAAAYNNLGVMYDRGEGVGQDTEAARRYYKKACDLGHQVGCNNLKALAPKHVAYKLNFDIQKKRV
ncbi:tetratricopeptide repeat protein [Helicobacter mehlei]|uniref:tetratricopeptide repeat protein n=1 Tax=Helicobacter mehlei TaxID=2316080 RepID=UPI0013CE33F1|nr:tetratricopeptide repeat protein [Helicobacter mehlei]